MPEVKPEAKPPAGLRHVVAGESAISSIDGPKGVLAYRGIDIHDLARRSTFEEVVFLLRGPGQLVEILLGDDHMAGRTGHAALARSFERLIRAPGEIEQALAGPALHFPVQCPVSAEEPYQCHPGKFSCTSAALSICLHAATSSSLSV